MTKITIKTFNCKDNYVFIPACCYAGNQFDVLECDYPPMFKPEQAKVDMPVTITDVPRLQKDGSGKLDINIGDAATPCIGIFSETLKRGILVFTVQEINGRNIGIEYENSEITLKWPGKQRVSEDHPIIETNIDPDTSEIKEIPHKILDFQCESLADFYRVFFENRKIMGLDSKLPEGIPFEKQFEIQRDKFNEMNYNKDHDFYMVGTDLTKGQVWQPGWTGGAISSYPLMKLGGELEKERALKTLEFLFSSQKASGFFVGIIDKDRVEYSDGFGYEGTENWHLIRKSADVLFYLFKHFTLMEERNIEIPQEFIAGTKKLADGFVRLFNKYGQFGQFVDVITGDICVGGSTSGAIAPAGLVEAYKFFGEPQYLEIAERSAEYYYQDSLSKGYTTGGPGEILQGIDSETAFGLLESYVALYDFTKDEKWLKYAKENAHYCSSWVVSYNYNFPPHSEFYRHDMKTVGTVFANIQNKHSAPGICTLPGDSLLKLWKWTNDPLYLELIKDIALTIGQYLSTDEDPIYDWDTDPKLRDAKDKSLIEGRRLPQGFINERVNLSDWEGYGKVGGVFNGSCWSETSNLLTLSDVIPQMKNLNII